METMRVLCIYLWDKTEVMPTTDILTVYKTVLDVYDDVEFVKELF